MIEDLIISRVEGRRRCWALCSFLAISVAALVVACAEASCPAGYARVNGVCTPPAEACEGAITKQVEMGCAPNPYLGGGRITYFRYELTVEPGPIIVSDAPFAASFTGRALPSAATVNSAEIILAEFVPDGFRRIALTEFQATVHVRRGAEGEDVVLKPASISTSCTYDEQGLKDPESPGPFPPCSPENDLEDGSNLDCTGLGGGPDQLNRCLPYVPLEVEECNEGDESGKCAELGQTGPGGPCELVGFCVTDELEILLEKADGDAYRGAYTAESSGRVLFGFADGSVDPGAYPLLENGPNRGAYDPDAMIAPALVGRLGPNGFRAVFAGFEVDFECLMGTGSRRADGVGTVDPLLSPSPDGALISCPIQAPE